MITNPYKPGMQVPYGYPYPTYPCGPQGAVQPAVPAIPNGTTINQAGAPTGQTGGGVNVPGLLPLEESYIENILRLNLGKMATIYMTYENNSQWNAKIFKGRIEAAGRDHIILSDPSTGMRYLLLMVNLDYITFDEELNYFYGGTPTPAGR